MHRARRPFRLRLSRTGVRAASTATRPQSRSWARPSSVAAPSTSASGLNAHSSSDRTPSSSLVSPSKWARPGQRPSNPSVDTKDPHSERREIPPHELGKFGEYRPLNRSSRSASSMQASSLLSGSSGMASIRSILSKDRIKVAAETLAEEEEKKAEKLDKGGKEEMEVLPLEREDYSLEANEGSILEPGGRGGKNDRRQYKERRSIAFRLDDDVVLPKHSRVSTTRVTSTKERKKKVKHAAKPVNLDIFIPSVVSVGNLARLLNVRLDTLLRKMVKAGMDAEASPTHILSSEYASLLAMEFGRNPVINDEAAFDIFPPPPPADLSTLPTRPPVVTIMGHVDHGKTTLLDTLRSTSVAKGEAGGITQHIGAFSVPVPTSGSNSGEIRTITFLDTPGHAAFSAMRARGAGVTDIAVLVVAADDGVMPQTREVIELVKKGDVGLVVAINKIDKPGVDLTKIENALLAEGVQLEVFGGEVPAVPVSGLTGQGLDQLVETISVLAEMQDLRAEREGLLQGYVLESRIQKGLGPVATVLVLRGCLKPAQHLICGLSHAKVRLMTDSNGKAVKAAYPGMPITVSGWKELPKAGDEVLEGPEADVKKALANRIRKAEMEATLGDMEAINEQRRIERERRDNETSVEPAEGEEAPTERAAEGPRELRLVIKGDVSGSVEAVAGALEGIGNHIAKVKVVTIGVGNVTESDVMRAKAADGLVVAFNVSAPRSVEVEAASQQVQILSSTIIYRLMDDIKDKVIALLPPIIEQRVTGEATVLQLFDIHLKGKKILKVAGGRVTNGVVDKTKLARVIRDGQTIHEGQLDTLRHQKRDMTEIPKGMECGMGFTKYDDLREGDLIQIYQNVEKPGTL